MTLKMKANIKKQWLAALRSGNYQQTASMLHRAGFDGGPDGFCCLGVLCDMARRDGVVEPEQMENEGGERYYKYDGGTAYLPGVVIDWAGLQWDDERGQYDPAQFEAAGRYMPSGECTLAMRNDRGETFEEIADIIEKYVVGV